MAERLSAMWDNVRRFADRHIRVAAMAVSVIAVAASVIYLVPVALALAAPAVDADLLAAHGRPVAFVFLDIDGKVIGRRGPVAGRPLRLTEMPAYLPAAFIAMEDRGFYGHHGVDFIGLTRAAFADLRARRIVAGGSTISQQTAKLLFDRRERTFSRKLAELARTAALEKSFSKQQILETYLNRIYLGDGAYGVDTAARTYFGVSAAQVSLPQAAMLAALTRAPSVFSPRRDLAVAQGRAARVLQAMADIGAVTAAQAAFAIAHPATVVPRAADTHSYFLDAATEDARQLAADSGARELVVQTTLDSRLQHQAEVIAADAVARYSRKLNFGQIAMVAMKPDGAVAAMVGGVNYAQSVFNRVIQAHRQPGSAFKPFVYLAALEAGISPWDWRDDQPVSIAGYQPSNYHDAHYGRLRLSDALARSVNTITVNLAQEVGVARVAAAARQAGIRSALQDNASLALGTNEVTPLELTAAYGFFANGGHVVTPVLVTRIEAAATGAVLYQRPPDNSPVTLDDQVRRDMVAMLYNVVTSGTGTAARLGSREAAGKTGTTQDYRDAWFVGFTTDYVAAVWLGNDDNHPMRRVTGGSLPAPLWKSLMTVAEGGAPPRPLDRTPGPPAMVEDPFANGQVSYVDDIDATPPLLPTDDRGDYIATGSGVGSRTVARVENNAPPPRSEPPATPPANPPPPRMIEPPAAEAQRDEQRLPYQAYLQRQDGREPDAVPPPAYYRPYQRPDAYGERDAAPPPTYYRPYTQRQEAYRWESDTAPPPAYYRPRPYYGTRDGGDGFIPDR